MHHAGIQPYPLPYFWIKGALLNSLNEFTPGVCIPGMHIAKKKKIKQLEQLKTSVMSQLIRTPKVIEGRSVDYAATHVG